MTREEILKKAQLSPQAFCPGCWHHVKKIMNVAVPQLTQVEGECTLAEIGGLAALEAIKAVVLADIEREAALAELNNVLGEDVSSIVKDEILFRHHDRDTLEDKEVLEGMLATLGFSMEDIK